MTDTYAPNAPIYLTANLENGENGTLTGVAGTWASDQGTITQNPNNPQEAELVNAPLGDFTATFTAQVNGFELTYTATVADQTPTSGTITGSSTPPADETTPAPVETAPSV